MSKHILRKTPAWMLLMGLLAGASGLHAQESANQTAVAGAAAVEAGSASAASTAETAAMGNASTTTSARSKQQAKGKSRKEVLATTRAALTQVEQPVQAGKPSGLLDVYQQALEKDQLYAAARAALEAAKTLPQQTGGQLLPQISAHGSWGKNETEQEYLLASRRFEQKYQSRTKSLRISMPLFRPQLWAEYARSKAEVRLAHAEFENAGQDLILRVSQAYFDALLAQDVMALAEAQKQTTAAQLQQAKRYFETGVGTITDVNSVQARFDNAAAQEIVAKNMFELRRNILQNMTGQEHPKLRSLGGRLRPEGQKPDAVEELTQTAMQGNASVRAAQAKYDMADKEVWRARSGHLPTLDLVASRSHERNPSYTTINQRINHKTVSLQLTIPLFSGGSTQGRVRQTIALREKSQNELEHARQMASLSVREQFLNVSAAIARIQAMQQQVKAQELILQSANKGKDLGVRTVVEVLDAQQMLFSAKRDLAQARHDYVITQFKLRKHAGLLDIEDIQKADAWLDQ